MYYSSMGWAFFNSEGTNGFPFIRIKLNKAAIFVRTKQGISSEQVSFYSPQVFGIFRNKHGIALILN